MSVGELRPPPTEDPLVGTVVCERYRVIKKLGEGGMGAVYLAEHVFIEKKVALKVLAPELARRHDLSARFLQEAKSASRIGHENVIDISDFGQSPEGYVFIAMEYLDGVDLGATMRERGPMPWQRSKEIIIQICKALRAAHAQGIVHRDMKPENIFLIQREGRPDFVKLLDFGIAKVMGLAEDAPRLTRTGMIFGTPEYMAPEQAEGKDADHRVDIYAAGCVIYHLITGQTPFAADSFMAMLTKHILEEPVSPSARRPDLAISPELDAVVMKALEKDRARRWQSMNELLDAVSAIRHSDTAVSAVAPGGTTKQMGGGTATAMKVITTTSRVSSTEALSRDSLDRELAPADERPRPLAPPNRKMILIVVGMIVGVCGAILWAVSGRKAAESQPAAVVQPAPPPAAVVPPPVAEAPAVAAPVEEKPAAPAARAASKKPASRRSSAPEESDKKPSKPGAPPELKPFPL